MNDPATKGLSRQSWFDAERTARDKGASLQDQRDTLRLKRALKRAVSRDIAPIHLIRAIRSDIRT